MEEMKTIYQVGGKLCKDFIGQISYTVCLDQTYEELDIEFSFGPQHFRPEDVTPELKQRLLDYCKKEYGIEEPTPEEWEDAVYHGMKTEIHTMATLNDTFIGNIHRQLTTRHMHFTATEATGRLCSAADYRGCVKSNHSGIFRIAGQHRLSADGTRTLRGTFYV